MNKPQDLEHVSYHPISEDDFIYALQKFQRESTADAIQVLMEKADNFIDTKIN